MLHATEPGSVFSMLDGVRLYLDMIEKTADVGEGKEYLCEMKLFQKGQWNGKLEVSLVNQLHRI